jgi:hypothetical protein
VNQTAAGATEPGSRTSDSGHGDPQGPSSGRRSSRFRPVWWALGFSALTTVGLGALTWGIVIAHALAYGVGAVVAPQTIAAVDGDRYRLAFALAVIASLASASSLAGLAARTPARTWNPVVQGLTAAILAAVAGASALLLTLGMNPIAFVAAFLG